MDNQVASQWIMYKYDGAVLTEQNDEIAVEFPLTLKLDGEEFATIVCTPTHLSDMIIGFLGAEGIIRFADEIQSMQIDEGRGFAHVELKNKQTVGKQMHSKRFIGSCCGKSRQFYFQNDMRTAKTIMTRSLISVRQCFHLMDQLQQQSADFQKTGGVHNAALYTSDEIILARTDIGRHNALDKIYGHVLQHPIPLSDKTIVFSGRVSSEVLLKVAKIGIGTLFSKSAPTDLALQLAQDLGITVVGFVRGKHLNVYTHPERIYI